MRKNTAISHIVKRDGRVAPFDRQNIITAMKKAFMATNELGRPEEDVEMVCIGYTAAIEQMLKEKYEEPINIESIQDEVEKLLMGTNPETAKAYILYRQNRTSSRERNTRLMREYHELVNMDAKHSNTKRENANIDGDTAMGTMLKFGTLGAKQYYRQFMLSDEANKAYSNGDIHLHDLDFYSLTTTCTQIDLIKLYYTNSFHIPVNYQISAYDKIRFEAPYHELTNAGHITYIEIDGDPLNNLDAFEAVVKCMAESGVGYGAINHPVDRCRNCRHTGVIKNACPKCASEGIEHIRRITGYLVGTTERFNNAKRAEEHDRIKHL